MIEEEFRVIAIRHKKIVKPLRNETGKLVRNGFVCLFAVDTIAGKDAVNKYFNEKNMPLI
jgi:hypothetical protein